MLHKFRWGERLPHFWSVKAVGVRCVLAGYGPVGQGKAVEARSGLVRRVEAVMAWPGPVRRVVAVD